MTAVSGSRLDYPAIEQDHSVILALVADIDALIRKSADRDEILVRFQELVRLSVEHFLREESLMEAYGYPRLAHHRQEHREVIDWLGHIEDAFVGGSTLSAPTNELTLEFFGAWVSRHLALLDNPMTAYLRKHHVDEQPEPAAKVDDLAQHLA